MRIDDNTICYPLGGETKRVTDSVKAQFNLIFPAIPSDAFCPSGFCSYGNLESKGATIVWGEFSEGVGKLIPEGESFDYVFDNYAKDVDTCKDLAACAKAWYG